MDLLVITKTGARFIHHNVNRFDSLKDGSIIVSDGYLKTLAVYNEPDAVVVIDTESLGEEVISDILNMDNLNLQILI